MMKQVFTMKPSSLTMHYRSRSFVTVLLSGLVVAACLSAPAAEPAPQDQTIVPPPGEYRVVDLNLDKVGSLRGATRNGRIPQPSNHSVRDIVSEVVVSKESISGNFAFVRHVDMRGLPSAIMYALAATIAADGTVSGAWKAADGRTGVITGTVRSEADLVKANAFSAKADWPCWSGPFTSMAATPTGVKLVDDFSKEARLAWRSEELTPQGPGNSLNYNGLALTHRTNGGGSSLIVAEGKVVINYYQPAGTEYMKDYTGRGVDVLDEMAAKATPPLQVSKWAKEKYLVKADDVVVCMDAVTGKTLWKNVFAEKSMNQPSHKGGAVNNTPCAGDGRVFAMGPGGVLHGMDLATGKVLWERTGMSAQKVAPWTGARNMCTAPIYAGGTLIMSDHGATLSGLDPATGKDLWKLPGKTFGALVPCKWTHKGQDHVITLTDAGIDKRIKGWDQFVVGRKLACIEPKAGRVLWELDITTIAWKGLLTVHGDVAYLTTQWYDRENFDNTERKPICTAYRLGLDKAEKIWETPVPKALGDPLPACNGSVVVVQGLGESYLLDPASGKVLATYAGNCGMTEAHTAIMEDRALLSLDGAHGHSEMNVLGATPETFSKLSCSWSQPHPQTTSYHNKFMTWPMVEGRIFMRGLDGVYCYDLRKTV